MPRSGCCHVAASATQARKSSLRVVELPEPVSQELHCVEQLAVDVELALVPRAVAVPDRPAAAPAGRQACRQLDAAGVAADDAGRLRPLLALGRRSPCFVRTPASPSRSGGARSAGAPALRADRGVGAHSGAAGYAEAPRCGGGAPERGCRPRRVRRRGGSVRAGRAAGRAWLPSWVQPSKVLPWRDSSASSQASAVRRSAVSRRGGEQVGVGGGQPRTGLRHLYVALSLPFNLPAQGSCIAVVQGLARGRPPRDPRSCELQVINGGRDGQSSPARRS